MRQADMVVVVVVVVADKLEKGICVRIMKL